MYDIINDQECPSLASKTKLHCQLDMWSWETYFPEVCSQTSKMGIKIALYIVKINFSKSHRCLTHHKPSVRGHYCNTSGYYNNSASWYSVSRCYYTFNYYNITASNCNIHTNKLLHSQLEQREILSLDSCLQHAVTHICEYSSPPLSFTSLSLHQPRIFPLNLDDSFFLSKYSTYFSGALASK